MFIPSESILPLFSPSLFPFPFLPPPSLSFFSLLLFPLDLNHTQKVLPYFEKIIKMSNYYTSKISVKYSARKLVPLRPTNKRVFAMRHGEWRNFNFEVRIWSCLSSGQRVRTGQADSSSCQPDPSSAAYCVPVPSPVTWGYETQGPSDSVLTCKVGVLQFTSP